MRVWIRVCSGQVERDRNGQDDDFPSVLHGQSAFAIILLPGLAGEHLENILDEGIELCLSWISGEGWEGA